ncbi:c-type cytochrome [Ekhidna sp.]
MKRVFNGFYVILSIFIIFNVLFLKCGNISASDVSKSENIYRTKCVRCHGKDGKKGRKGAKDLTISTKSLSYRINQLKNGKGKMPSFSERLTDEQIEMVAKYSITQFMNDSTLLKK